MAAADWPRSARTPSVRPGARPPHLRLRCSTDSRNQHEASRARQAQKFRSLWAGLIPSRHFPSNNFQPQSKAKISLSHAENRPSACLRTVYETTERLPDGNQISTQEKLASVCRRKELRGQHCLAGISESNQISKWKQTVLQILELFSRFCWTKNQRKFPSKYRATSFPKFYGNRPKKSKKFKTDEIQQNPYESKWVEAGEKLFFQNSHYVFTKKRSN